MHLIPLTVMCWLLGTPTTDIRFPRSWVLPMAEAVAYSGGREATSEVKSAYQDFFEYFSNHIEKEKII